MNLKKLFFRQKKEGQFEDAAWFLALAIAFGMLFNAAFSQTDFFVQAAAFSSQPLLQAIGIDAVIEQKDFPHLVGSVGERFFDAEINFLCGGAVELAVLLAFIAASRDRSIKQRVLGMFFGAIVLFIFNPVRIALTLLLYGSQHFVLAHDVLFRISIVLVIVGAYGAWYALLTGRHK